MTTTEADRTTTDRANEGRPSRSGFRRILPATPAQYVVGVAALMFLAGAIGYVIGVRDGDAPSAGTADVGFLYDMTAHHEQAVTLSMLELTNGSDPSIQAFAREIIRSQAYEMGLMWMRLGMWGYDPAAPTQQPMAWMGMTVPSTDAMPGMADAAELDALRNAEGADADALFLALMSDHHAGGVAMAQAAANRADDAWVVDTAQRMARIQTSEIAEMEFARENAGLPATPAGFTPDFGAVAEPMSDMDMDSSDPDAGDGG